MVTEESAATTAYGACILGIGTNRDVGDVYQVLVGIRQGTSLVEERSRRARQLGQVGRQSA